MRLPLKVAVAATAATAVLVAPAVPASAHTGVPVKGGTTKVTTAPGIAGVLVKNGLFAYGVRPGKTGLVTTGGLALSFSFPVTGGRASVDPLGGTIKHKGSIAFVNFANGKRVKVGNFTIDLGAGNLTGIVNGDPKARVALFTLDLSHAKLKVSKHRVTATGIGLKFTAAAAGALNKGLHTKVFAGGLLLGTASTTIKI